MRLRNLAPARRRTTVALGGVGVAALLAATCSGCSSVPPAAIVNGVTISEAQFDAQLNGMGSDAAYVSQFDQEYASYVAEVEQEDQQQIPLVTQQGSGSGPGNYNMQWAIFQLDRVVYGTVLGQYVRREHKEPSATEVTAVWDAQDAAAPAAWRGYSPQLRAIFAQEAADHVQIERGLSDASVDKEFFDQYKAYFWSRVCVDEYDIAVPGQNGGVNLSASRAQADRLAAALNSGAASSATGVGGVTSGARYCLTPEQLVERSAAYLSGVGELAPGKAVAVLGSSDYEVVQVRSRTLLPFDATVKSAVDMVAVRGGYQDLGGGDTPLIKLLKTAKVEVNPEYGAWAAPTQSGQPPGVDPPTSLLVRHS